MIFYTEINTVYCWGAV